MVYYIKLIAGYILLFAIIICFIGIIYNERIQRVQIELVVSEIQGLRRLINNAHEQIMELSLLGESVTGWSMNDYNRYKEKRILLDSLLQSAEPFCKEFIPYEDVDSLRNLFIQKEMFLFRFMQMFHENAETDVRLLQQFTVIGKDAMERNKEVNRQTWISALFKRKDKKKENLSLNRLHSLNRILTKEQQCRERVFENYIDSLRQQNILLNSKMNGLITNLDLKTLDVIRNKEEKIQKLYSFSFELIIAGIGCSLLLFVFSFFTIYRDRKQHTVANKMLETALKQNGLLVDSQKKIMLAVSHDIRGPLGTILNSSELAMGIRDKKRRNVYLENIQNTCRHILRIVNDLMDVYRINEGKDTLNIVPFKLKQFLDKISDTYTYQANLTGLAFKNEYEGVDITVLGDPDRVKRILDNLLSNAVKFTKNGSISLQASYKEGNLFLTIQDTGIGMSEKTLSEVFEPLVRAALDVDSSGFGLGLSIVRGLVNHMSGRLDVDSKVGKGTIFKIMLPLPETDEIVHPAELPSSWPTALPKKVIVVDDDRMQLAIIREMLECNGITCIVCERIKEVVLALKKDECDLILTDIQMAGASGFDLLTLLRSSNIGNSRTIPVIAMTACGDERKDSYLQAGFYNCIFKPFSMKELFSVLSSLSIRVKVDTGLDFSLLTDGIRNQSDILRLFISESVRDIKELEEALKHNRRKRMQETIHRMLPIWSLLQCEYKLYAYQEILKDQNLSVEILEQETEQIIWQMKIFISEAEKEILKLEYEKKDIDC